MTKYVGGRDLETVVRLGGALAPERAAAVVGAVADGLDAIHAAGLVHRDVKPANVLLDEAGHVWVGDFGLARPVDGGTGPTDPGAWVGTAGFAAPEQIRGEAVDARTDVYALGCVLFFTLTGRSPFARESVSATHVGAPHRHAALAAAGPRGVRPRRRPRAVQGSGRPLHLRGRARRRGPGGRGRWLVGVGDRRVAPPPPAAAPRAPPSRARRGRRCRAAGRRRRRCSSRSTGAARSRPATPTPTPTPTATPAPDRTITVADVGTQPRGIALAAGDVWVVEPVERPLDAHRRGATRACTCPPPASATGPRDITAEGDRLWVTNPGTDEVLQVDAVSGALEQRVARRLAVRGGGGPRRAVGGRAGRSGSTSARRTSPTCCGGSTVAGSRSASRSRSTAGIRAIALGGGFVWVSLWDEGTILQLTKRGAEVDSVRDRPSPRTT